MKRVLVGRTLSSHKLEHQLLPKILALPVFSSDALSSVAYATEEMLLVLVAAGASALSLSIPIGLAIAGLLAIVVTSYRQTVRAYPRGGGSYIVSRENLGTIPGLVAAAAILTDYVLTVAVSVTAGTIAVTSAIPGAANHKVGIALVFLALLTLANLRGVREAGAIFALPTYGFVAMVFVTLIVGFARCITQCPQAATAGIPVEPLGALALFLLLRAFASGATALTGVEAIADGVQAFRRPQSKNAATTLAVMGAMSISMFLGITLLANFLHIRVTEEIAMTKSVLAQLGETVFGRGLVFFLLQGFTAGILVLAANTSYQDFPRLSSILARDRFMPSQFRNRGDRLVFSNGVVALAVLSGILIWAYDAHLTKLIQLYVVGVFTAFTLSQAGMVRRWNRVKGEGWRRSMIINAIGATATGMVLVVVVATKFTHGAWIVLVAVPVIVAFFLAVHRHYASIGGLLRSRRISMQQEPRISFVLLVADLGPATSQAVAYLRAIRPEHVTPLYTGPSERFEDVAVRWRSLAPRLGQIEPLPEPNGRPIRAIRHYLQAVPRTPGDFLNVIVPETLSSRSVLQFLRKRSAFWLKATLLFEPGVVVTDIPLFVHGEAKEGGQPRRPVEPQHHVVLVPVSAVHAASARALLYAKSLHASVLEALFFSSDPEDLVDIQEQWAEWRIDVALAVIDAPFRDMRGPLLHEVQRYTTRGDTVVTVILPEFVVRSWWEHLLHNQIGLYIKRMLLFEPGVVVTSIPYHLAAEDHEPLEQTTEPTT
jgi:amino acid transporter